MYIVSYADDFLILAGADNRARLEVTVNEYINHFSNICEDLHLSPQKSVAIMFGRFILENRRPIFKLQGISIPVRNNLTYLGFSLDPKFNWLNHLDTVREKITPFLLNMKKTGRRDRGLSASFLKVWYEVVVKKQIIYGYEVWFPDLRIHGLRKLSSCQRMGLIAILRPYKTVSTDALCVLCGVVPLHIELKHLVKKFIILSGNSYIDLQEFRVNGADVVQKVPTFSFPSFYLLKNLNFMVHTKNLIMDTDKVLIFTDGSKMAGGVASAFTVYFGTSFIHDSFKTR